MGEKDPNEQMLSLLREIDAKLTKIQIGIAKDKMRSRMGDYSFSNFFINFLTLVLQINIAFWGYRYIATTNEAIPVIAIIGTIGIAFVVISSTLKVLNDFYSLGVAYNKSKRLARSFAYLIPTLMRLESELDKFDPDKISDKNIEQLVQFKSVSDDLVKRLIEIGEGNKNVDDFVDELEKASSPLKNACPVEQNP